jgi:hypothetical protein
MTVKIRTFECEDKLWNAFKRVAKKDERSASWLLRKLMTDCIAEHKKEK